LCTQVKLIRVLAIVTGESKGEILSFRPIGRFVLPKARPRTYLCFEFSSSSSSNSNNGSPSSSVSAAPPAPLRANILTFQFLSNYGGRETQPPKIYLFHHSLSTPAAAAGGLAGSE
jgi:hypothetical protein